MVADDFSQFTIASFWKPERAGYNTDETRYVAVSLANDVTMGCCPIFKTL